jgi:lysophospholipase L1-like esterase
MRYLALGDSYTIGESVSTADRWPVQLAALLRQQGIDAGEPQIIARTGWTTDELSAGIDLAGPRGPFEMVSLLIGVNNQYRGRPLDEYREQYVALLLRAIDLAGGAAGRVLVLSIPDWSVTPFAKGQDRAAIRSAIDDFNRINAEETQRLGARYIDVTPESRQAASDPTLIARDGLHPSGKMYAEWAQLALPAACAALAQP